jgi:hypothetical protein
MTCKNLLEPIQLVLALCVALHESLYRLFKMGAPQLQQTWNGFELLEARLKGSHIPKKSYKLMKHGYTSTLYFILGTPLSARSLYATCPY